MDDKNNFNTASGPQEQNNEWDKMRDVPFAGDEQNERSEEDTAKLMEDIASGRYSLKSGEYIVDIPSEPKTEENPENREPEIVEETQPTPEMVKNSQEHVDAMANMIMTYADTHNIQRVKNQYGLDKFEISDPAVRGELIDFLSKAAKTETSAKDQLFVDTSLLHNRIRDYVSTPGNIDDFMSSITDENLNDRQRENARELCLDYNHPHWLARNYDIFDMSEKGISPIDILDRATPQEIEHGLYSYFNSPFEHDLVLQKLDYRFYLDDGYGNDKDDRFINYLRNTGYKGEEILYNAQDSNDLLRSYYDWEPEYDETISGDDDDKKQRLYDYLIDSKGINPYDMQARREFVKANFSPEEILKATDQEMLSEENIHRLVEDGVAPKTILNYVTNYYRGEAFGTKGGDIDHGYFSTTDLYEPGNTEYIVEACFNEGLTVDEFLEDDTGGILAQCREDTIVSIRDYNIVATVLNHADNKTTKSIDTIDRINEKIYSLDNKDYANASEEEKNAERSRTMYVWARGKRVYDY